MPEIAVEYKVPAAWQKMFQDGLKTIATLRQQIFAAKASILDSEQEIQRLRHTMSVVIGVLEKTEGLPKSVDGYHLSLDGTTIYGKKAAEAGIGTELGQNQEG